MDDATARSKAAHGLAVLEALADTWAVRKLGPEWCAADLKIKAEACNATQ